MMTPREQFNRVDHDSNPSQSMTLTACPVGRLGEGISPPPPSQWAIVACARNIFPFF